MISGTLDLYPEYTGTSYTRFFRHAPITDPRAVYEQVKEEYANQFKVEVSQPLGFENTFAILVRGDDARQLNLKRSPKRRRTLERGARGLVRISCRGPMVIPGFSKTYKLNFREVREMDLSLTYIALKSKQVDLIAGNSTEGRIRQLDLVQPQRRSPLLSTVRSCLPRSPGHARTRTSTQRGINKLANAISDRRDAST